MSVVGSVFRSPVRGGVQSVFSPAETFPPILLQGTAWYRSDRLITLNGSTVSAWGDLTGNGNTATQATEANQPTYTASAIGGKPGLTYGSDDVLGISFAQVAPIYVFVVVDTTNLGTGYRQLLSRSAGGPALYLGGSGNDRKPLVFWGTDRATWGSALTETYVIRFRMEADGTTGVKVNTGAEVTSPPNLTSLGEWTTWGVDGSQNIGGAIVSEGAILQGSALTDTESDSIINYMMSRYEI